MMDGNDAAPRSHHSAQHGDDCLFRRRINRSEGFIHQIQVSILRQRARQKHALLLPAGKPADLPIRKISQPHLFQSTECRIPFRLGHAAPPAHARIARHANDIERGCWKIPIHRSALWQIADAVAYFRKAAAKKPRLTSDARDQAKGGAQ